MTKFCLVNFFNPQKCLNFSLNFFLLHQNSHDFHSNVLSERRAVMTTIYTHDLQVIQKGCTVHKMKTGCRVR